MIFLFISFLIPNHTYSAATVRVAKVVQFTGDVQWRKKVVVDKLMNRLSEEMGIDSLKVDTSYSKVRINLFLSEEDWLKTGAESEVLLLLKDGTKLKIGENSLFSVTSCIENSDASHKMVSYIRAGSILCNVKKIASKRGSFKLCTPTATCSIRGTVFETSVGSDGSSKINVIEGVIDVSLVGVDFVIQVHENTQAKIEKGSKTIATSDIPSEEKKKLDKEVKKVIKKEETTKKDDSKEDVTSDVIDEITQEETEPIKDEIPIEEILETNPSPSSPDK